MTFDAYQCFPDDMSYSTISEAQTYIEAAMPITIAAFRAIGLDARAGSPATLYPSIFSGSISADMEARTFCIPITDTYLLVATYNVKYEVTTTGVLTASNYNSNSKYFTSLILYRVDLYPVNNTIYTYITFRHSIGVTSTANLKLRKLVVLNNRFIIPMGTLVPTTWNAYGDNYRALLFYYTNNNMVLIGNLNQNGYNSGHIKIEGNAVNGFPDSYKKDFNYTIASNYDAILYNVYNAYFINPSIYSATIQGFTTINGDEFIIILGILIKISGNIDGI